MIGCGWEDYNVQNFRMLHMEAPFHHDSGANAKSCEMPIIAGATAAVPPPRIQNEAPTQAGHGQAGREISADFQGQNAAVKCRPWADRRGE